ncbi:MAG: hypothetical protein MUF15_24050 [Acidobacteria bacterium]|nr:hypothetical protein [Acidobacteriota bacterium]
MQTSNLAFAPYMALMNNVQETYKNSFAAETCIIPGSAAKPEIKNDKKYSLPSLQMYGYR